MGIAFTKMHGAGNDFVVLEGEEDWPSLARALAARRRGAGSDGLLVALPSERADVRMRMFNPDGTEDECGNGLRCLALYAYRRGLVSSPEFTLESLSGVKQVRVSGVERRRALVTVELGRADLEPAAIPAALPGPHALGVPLELDGVSLELHSLSTGTAHTVVFRTPSEAEFQRLSPLLEHHPLFPERTSVMWTEVEAAGRLRVRIWERGAGETLACGTGACAAAVAAYLSGRSGPRSEVTSRGGTLVVEIGEGLSLTMTGPAEFVYEGVWGLRV